MADLTATFRQPFAEQVAAWRIRLGNQVPTAAWDDLWQAQHDRAFVVAGALKADLLADLAGAVDKAITRGTTLEEFRRDFRQIVAERGWHGWTGEGSVRGEAWRTRVIYETNMRTSYMAGRFAQLQRGNFAFWVYRHSGAAEPRLQHLSWDGVGLPPDHPFWATHYPPNGWGCGCRVFGADTAAGIKRLGGDPDKPLPDGWQTTDPRTGAPVGIDKGWAYAPGESVAQTVNAAMGKLPVLPAPIGAAMAAALPAQARRSLTEKFGEFVDRSLSSYVQRDFMVIGALKPEWIRAAEDRGYKVATAEIAVIDRDIQHTFRGTGLVTAPMRRVSETKVAPLDLDWYRRLPEHLSNPTAVFFDASRTPPAYILIFEVPGTNAKIVVEVGTWIRKAQGTLNTATTGRYVTDEDILADIGRGYVQISGPPFIEGG